MLSENRARLHNIKDGDKHNCDLFCSWHFQEETVAPIASAFQSNPVSTDLFWKEETIATIATIAIASRPYSNYFWRKLFSIQVLQLSSDPWCCRPGSKGVLLPQKM